MAFSMPGMSGSGVSALLGQALEGSSGFSSGLDPQAGCASMIEAIQRFFTQSSAESQKALATWQASADRAGFPPDFSKAPSQQFAAFQKFARENGSRDGTPVADWTDAQADLAAAQYLDLLADRQDQLVLDLAKEGTPAEREALEAEELKLQEAILARRTAGQPMTGEEKLRAWSDRAESLYREGRLGPDLGEAHRDARAIRECASSAWAQALLKKRGEVPSEAPPEDVAGATFPEGPAAAAEGTTATIAAGSTTRSSSLASLLRS